MANGLRAESIRPCTGREDAHFNRRIRRTDNECRTKNKNNKKQPSTLKLGVKWHWNGALVRLGARRCPDVLFFHGFLHRKPIIPPMNSIVQVLARINSLNCDSSNGALIFVRLRSWLKRKIRVGMNFVVTFSIRCRCSNDFAKPTIIGQCREKDELSSRSREEGNRRSASGSVMKFGRLFHKVRFQIETRRLRNSTSRELNCKVHRARIDAHAKRDEKSLKMRRKKSPRGKGESALGPRGRETSAHHRRRMEGARGEK